MIEIRKILLVDDDPNVRKLAKMSLERVGGWQVATAASGEEALEIVGEESPDVIILDVMMPGLDGKATLIKLKSRPEIASVVVVVMTAKVHGQDMDEYLGLGAAGVIVKPFDPLKLPDQIRSLAKGSRL